MRKQLFRLFFAISLSVLSFVTPAGANSGNELQATIPFEFTLRNETLPAGTYTISTTTVKGFFLIQNEDRSRATYFLTAPDLTRANPETTKLTFRKYGDRYFLAEVTAYDAGYRVQQSRKERQMLKEIRTYRRKEPSGPVLVYVGANLMPKICANK
jgi:hypothetical protein